MHIDVYLSKSIVFHLTMLQLVEELQEILEHDRLDAKRKSFRCLLERTNEQRLTCWMPVNSVQKFDRIGLIVGRQ